MNTLAQLLGDSHLHVRAFSLLIEDPRQTPFLVAGFWDAAFVGNIVGTVLLFDICTRLGGAAMIRCVYTLDECIGRDSDDDINDRDESEVTSPNTATHW